MAQNVDSMQIQTALECQKYVNRNTCQHSLLGSQAQNINMRHLQTILFIINIILIVLQLF